MKPALHLATLLVFLASPLLSPVCAQQNSAEEFVSLSEGFAIKLPARYNDYKPFVPMRIGNEDHNLSLLKWNTSAGLITVGYMRGTRNWEEPDLSKRFFEGFRKLIASKIADKGRLVGERSISLDTHPGLEFVVENSGQINAFRIFLVRNRFFMLTLVTEPGQRDAVPSGDEILLSFRLLPRSEVVAIRDRKLESIDWPPLPQYSSSTRLKTDAEDLNLKGRVKQILTESEYVYDGVLSDIRTSDEMKEFDRRGYLTREVRFESESPMSITSFSHANETLTSKKVLVGQFANGRTIGLSPMRTGMQVTRETKFKYRDDGRLSEIQTSENGEMIQRSILSYSGNKRETETWEYFRVLRTKTESRSKLTEILDSNGNPLETTASQFQSAGDPMAPGGRYEQKVSEEKCEYTYEFDSQGNWIKRIKFLRTFAKVRGTTVYTEKVKEPVPSLVTYRTITYYQ